MGRQIRRVLAIVLIFFFLTSSGAALSAGSSGQTTYKVRETKTSWTMSDGIKLPVSIYTPVTNNSGMRFPVIVFVHGWMCDKSMLDVKAREFAGRGYVTVTYTVRGWLGAGGTINAIDPDHEMKDLSTIITLVSRGTQFHVLKDSKGPVVGVTGYSMGGLHSYLIAHRKNPRQGDPGDRRVRAVVPMHGGVDLLTSLYPNGVIKWFWAAMLLGGSSFGNISGALMSVMNVLADKALSPLQKLAAVTNTFRCLLEKPLNSADPILNDIYNVATQRRIAAVDWAMMYFKKRSARWWCDEEMDGVVEHPFDVPILMTTSWNDDLFTPNEAIGVLNTMVAAPKRIIITSGGHAGGYSMPLPGVSSEPNAETALIDRETERWFDRFLKGTRNGVENGPRVTYYRSWDPENMGTSSCWPPAGTVDKTYYPGSGTEFRTAVLGGSAATSSRPDLLINTGFSGSISLPYFNDIPRTMGLNLTVDIPEKIDLLPMPMQHYSYITKPTDKALFINGAPRLAVDYKSTSTFTQLIPRLYEVSPNGKQTLISRGWYEGNRMGIWNGPGNGNMIEMVSCCHKVPAGSRLKLEIRTSDMLESWPMWDFSIIRLFHDGGDSTRLMLPVTPQ
jgi:putative CocE/NonD family hydrolase